MYLTFLASLIALICMLGFLPGMQKKPFCPANSYIFSSIKAPQSQASHKRAKRLTVREISTEGLKALLALGKDRQQPLLVNFWATWCEPCREEFPDLIRASKRYDSSKLDFVSISLDDVAEIKTKVPKFLQQMNAQMPSYLLNVSEPDEAIKTVSDTWTGELPATFIVDREGRIVFQHTGRIKLEALSAALRALIKN